MSYEICVVGSANADISVPVEALPEPGQTLLGGSARRSPGGKGANQAAAAARIGRSSALLGCLGTDDAGDLVQAALLDAGVATELLIRSGSAPTGLAVILVSPDDNMIVVSPGANSALLPRHVHEHADAIRSAAIVLTQLEIPVETVHAAAEVAGGRFVLNPAPARVLPAALLERVDILVPNRSELATLAGSPEPTSMDETVDLARHLKVTATIVVTLGAQGALVVDGGAVDHVPAVPVHAVDPTAAGDTFCAALCDALLDGATAADAAAWAVRAASVTVSREGAITATPSREDVLALSP
jgi:ribokinase